MRMLLSDIWSRSHFWVIVHASWVLMLVKQLIHSPSYRLNQSLLLQMLVSFDRSVWAILRIFVAQNGTWNVPGISVSLAITNKASPILSLIEKFAKIAVYKSICRSSHRHPNQLSPVFAIIYRPLHFYWQKHLFDSLICLSRKRLIILLTKNIVYTQW